MAHVFVSLVVFTLPLADSVPLSIVLQGAQLIKPKQSISITHSLFRAVSTPAEEGREAPGGPAGTSDGDSAGMRLDARCSTTPGCEG